MRPSKFTKPVFHKSKILPPKGFMAITLFGHVFVREEYWSYQVSSDFHKMQIWNRMKFHETIHIRQAAKEHDSWFIFYMKYLGYWIRNMFHCRFKNTVTYNCIPYEMEAYYKETYWKDEPDYNCDLLDRFKNIPYKLAIKITKESCLFRWNILDSLLCKNEEQISELISEYRKER